MSRERDPLRPPEPGEAPRAVFEPPPAPVYTEDGLFGEPIPFEVYDQRVRERGPGLAWLLGFLAAIGVALWLATLSVAQATSEAPALAALERAVAALTEVDALLGLHLEEVQARADAGDQTLTLPAFPVRDAGVETTGVTGDGGAVDRERLREALLDRSARLVYMRGPDALRQDGVEPVQTPLSRESWEIGLVFLNQARTVSFAIAVAFAVALYFFLTRSSLGKALRAAADNPIAAAYVGIDVDRAHGLAFGLGVGITAVAGGLIASSQSFQPYIGFDFVIVMYAGVVLGGMGSILGAFWGGLTIGLVQQMSTLVLPYQLQNTAIFVVFLLIIFFRPQGMFGRVWERT